MEVKRDEGRKKESEREREEEEVVWGKAVRERRGESQSWLPSIMAQSLFWVSTSWRTRYYQTIPLLAEEEKNPTYNLAYFILIICMSLA